MTHLALHTPLIDLLGCDVPILLAGMGGVARHELAAAVSNAGGFGCMGMVREPVALIRREVDAYRQLSQRPFAVNLIPAATPRDLLAAQVSSCLALAVPAMVLFWEVDAALIAQLKAEGVLVLHQVGSKKDAELALRAGADVLIAQGVEAGGHVRGTTSTLTLLPEIVALSAVPVVASGGIASGEALVAALAMGAQGVSCGSAFLATHEANAHLHHKQRVLKAGSDDTILTYKFFRNWPMPAAVRVLANAVTEGKYDDLYQKKETPVIGQQDNSPVYLFSTDSPLRDASGEIDDMAIYAGQSCGQIQNICSAAERVKKLIEQATLCLERLQPAATSEKSSSAFTAPVSSDMALVPVLQELLSAERAGARIAASSLREAKTNVQREFLEQLHRGEADSCRRLRLCLTHLGVEPGREVGAFYEKCMAIANLEERFVLVAKGQSWVAKKIRENLPDCCDELLRRELAAVLQTHTHD
jgi:nitronate monooxygenase